MAHRLPWSEITYSTERLGKRSSRRRLADRYAIAHCSDGFLSARVDSLCSTIVAASILNLAYVCCVSFADGRIRRGGLSSPFGFNEYCADSAGSRMWDACKSVGPRLRIVQSHLTPTATTATVSSLRTATGDLTPLRAMLNLLHRGLCESSPSQSSNWEIDPEALRVSPVASPEMLIESVHRNLFAVTVWPRDTRQT